MTKRITKELVFVSRHKPAFAQVKTAEAMGYSSLRRVEVVFGDDPVVDLKNAGIENLTIAIVAPLSVCAKLLNAGYTLIEFANMPSARQRGVFLCLGANEYTPGDWLYGRPAEGNADKGLIGINWTPCPVPIEEQEESSLAPKSRA